MKRLSVIIPVYNAEKHIMRCVNSILPQLTQDDELLLINDGSTDGSKEILEKIEKDNIVVRVINKENEGVAKTRNRGIKEAKGEYICFVDNDDFLDAQYISTFYNEISRGNYDVVLGGYKRVSDQKVLKRVVGKPSDWYKFRIIVPWGRIFRREFLIKHDVQFFDYGIGEDIYFNFQIYTKTDKIKVIEYCGYNWWYNDESISNTDHVGLKKELPIEKLLNALYDITGSGQYYSWFYVRFVVWFLLYSGKSATEEDFIRVCEESFGWLSEHRISLKFPIFNKKIAGENLSTKMIVNIMILLYRSRLIRLFAKLYCKG